MFFPRRTSACLIAAAIFLAASAATFPIRESLVKDARVLSARALGAASGKGLLFGVLGGYRTLAADFVWLKGYVDWEKKDMAGCVSAIELATAIDPDMILFWTQGASIIAFDTPHWLAEKANMRGENALAVFKHRQGKIALKLLDEALAMFPDNRELLIQKGQIAIGIGDFKTAESCFARLAQDPDASVYVLRIYASLLAKSGKFSESIKTLERVLNGEPADSPIRQTILDQILRAQAALEKTAK